MESKPNRKRSFIIALSLLTLALLTWGGVALFRDWSQPLAPSLELPTPSPNIAAVDQEVEDGASTQSDQDTDGIEEPVTEPGVDGTSLAEQETRERLPLCGGPRELLILAVAADSGDENYLYGLADAIRLVHIDFVTPKVVVFALPRDLWVEIPGISDSYGITHGKLNQAYLYGNPGLGYYDGPGFGPGLLARTLAHNFGIYVDHYGALSMRTFVDIVDTVGGIDIYLEESVDGNFDAGLDDYFEDFGFFPAGWNHLDGQQALSFSRIRSVDSTFGRQDRQSMIILALREKALSLSGASHFPNMIRAFQGRTQTDLSKEQLSQLTCLASRLGAENIVFTTIPDRFLIQTSVYSNQLKGYTFIFDANLDEVGEYIRSQFQSP